MSRLVWIAGSVLVLVGSLGAYLWFSAGSGEPSTELTTPTLPEGPTTATSGDPGASTTAGVAQGETEVFVITAEESTATFEVDEVLRGEPNHVVGTTSEVAGQVQVDPSDLSTVVLSQIVVNARTFTTDSGLRDRAIRGPVILDSGNDEFELITFDPISIEGLSGEAGVGNTLRFTVTGDLTIKGTTREATFEVEVTFASEERLEGTAVTTVLRADYGIGIPNVAQVASVDEEVLIRLDFVALAA